MRAKELKPLYKTIKVTDKTKTSNLPVMDQIRLLFGMVSNDETAQMEASEKISRANLEVQSAFSSFIDKVTNKMHELHETSVTVAVSSRFKPYFESILSEETGKGRFYNFEVENKDIPVEGADYYLIVRISEKEVANGVSR